MVEKEDLRNELIEFQNMQQQMQIILMQKQQMQVQLQEIERAKEELGKNAGKGAIYRFVGSVFIPKSADALQKELAEEREALELRRSGLQKQEGKLAERMNAIKKKVEAYQKEHGEGATVG